MTSKRSAAGRRTRHAIWDVLLVPPELQGKARTRVCPSRKTPGQGLVFHDKWIYSILGADLIGLYTIITLINRGHAIIMTVSSVDG